MTKLHLFFRRNIRFYLHLDKTQRFAIQTVFLTAGILLTQLIWDDYRFLMVGILAVCAYALTIWSLSEDIKGIEWLMLFILPVLFTFSVSLFYFLLPARWIIRLSTTTIFAIGTYAILKAVNIYNVAVNRSIPLLRVAQTSGLLITLVVVFLVSNIVLSLKMPFWANSIVVFPLIFLLSLQSFWSITLENHISRNLLMNSLLVAVIVGEESIALSFWPLQLSTASLFFAATYYAVTGIIQQHLQGRLFRNTIREYIFAFIIAFALLLLTSSWG
ncbi:hypothetical protein HYW55_01590 [Candidatus Gottesmanbacteria bacterium]|nr:hypothetical protein [Candidatus Gottesmanbacteria bacterium]